jgi:hypothetical protein
MTGRLYDGATPWTGDGATADLSRLQAVKNHGGIGVSVYIVGTPGGMRCANQRDVDTARSLGLGVLPNWERAADYFRTCTLDQAHAAGVEAKQACQRLGFPDDGSVTVIFSFDYQVPATGFPAALDRLKACHDGLGAAYKAASYAQSGLIRYFGAHGFGDVGHWLMASTWGLADYDIGSANVALVQSHEANGTWLNTPVPGTDINTVTRPTLLGAWWPEGSEYAPMAITVDDIWNASWALDGESSPQTARRRLTIAEHRATDAVAAIAALAKQVGDLQAAVAKLQASAITGTVHLAGDVTVTQ